MRALRGHGRTARRKRLLEVLGDLLAVSYFLYKIVDFVLKNYNSVTHFVSSRVEFRTPIWNSLFLASSGR